MKKTELINALAARSNLPKICAEALLDSLRSVAIETIAKGEDFAIPGLCRMTVAERRARTARNPATGEPVAVPAKRVIKAKVGADLRGLV